MVIYVIEWNDNQEKCCLDWPSSCALFSAMLVLNRSTRHFAVDKTIKSVGFGKMYAQNAAKVQSLSDTVSDVQRSVAQLEEL